METTVRAYRAHCSALLLVALLTGCAGVPSIQQPSPPLAVDLPRFMGSWHVIANIPYWLENGKVATRDEYRLRADGRIDNDFVFRRGFDRPEQRWRGVSSVIPGSAGSLWKVQFVWPFSARLQVLEVSPDYRWALLASPDRTLAWVFAREPQIDTALYADLLQRMAGHGVDRCALRQVPQRPEDLGQASIAPPGCAD
jgi:apolipoprotein D and lipocalin family protein